MIENSHKPEATHIYLRPIVLSVQTVNLEDSRGGHLLVVLRVLSATSDSDAYWHGLSVDNVPSAFMLHVQ